MSDIVKTFDPATGLETWKEVSTGSAGFLSRKFYTVTLSTANSFIDVPSGSMQFTTRAGIDVYINGDYQDNVTVPQAQRITPSEPFQAGDVVAVVSYRTVAGEAEQQQAVFVQDDLPVVDGVAVLFRTGQFGDPTIAELWVAQP